MPIRFIAKIKSQNLSETTALSGLGRSLEANGYEVDFGLRKLVLHEKRIKTFFSVVLKSVMRAPVIVEVAEDHLKLVFDAGPLAAMVVVGLVTAWLGSVLSRIVETPGLKEVTFVLGILSVVGGVMAFASTVSAVRNDVRDALQ